MTCGRCSIKLEFGDGSSARWMASAEASSTSNDRSVKTLRSRKVMMTRLTTKKITTPRRMMKRCVRLAEEIGGKERKDETTLKPSNEPQLGGLYQVVTSCRW